MEEELGEKIDALQRELGQARAGAVESRQAEELKKVFGSWGARREGWGVRSLPRLSMRIPT